MMMPLTSTMFLENHLTLLILRADQKDPLPVTLHYKMPKLDALTFLQKNQCKRHQALRSGTSMKRFEEFRKGSRRAMNRRENWISTKSTSKPQTFLEDSPAIPSLRLINLQWQTGDNYSTAMYLQSD